MANPRYEKLNFEEKDVAMSAYPRVATPSSLAAPAAPVQVHVTVGGSTGAAAPAPLGSPSPANSTQPMYYGQPSGNYLPVTQNEYVEGRAPAPVAVVGSINGMPALTPAAAPANMYPAQAAALPVAHPPVVLAAAPAPGGNGLAQPLNDLIMVVPPVAQSQQELTQTLRARKVPFTSCRYISEGWTFFKPNFCALLGAQVVWVILLVLSYIALLGLFVAAGWEKWYRHGHQGGGDSDDSDAGDYEGSPGRGSWIAGTIRNLLWESLMMVPAMVGFYHAVFEAMKNNARLKVADTFGAFKCPYYLRVMGLGLLMGLLSRVLLMLFLVPGLIFIVMSSLAYKFHLQYQHIKLRAGKAIHLSFIVLAKYVCCDYLGFLFLITLINLLGLLCFGVGLLVTIPVTLAAEAYLYHALVGVNGMPVLVSASQYQAAQVAQAQAPQQVAIVMPAAPAPQQQQQQAQAAAAAQAQQLAAAQAAAAAANAQLAAAQAQVVQAQAAAAQAQAQAQQAAARAAATAAAAPPAYYGEPVQI